MTKEWWIIEDKTFTQPDSTRLLYQMWALPTPEAPFYRYTTGYYTIACLPIPEEIDVPMSHHLAVAKNSPTPAQLMEMKISLFTLDEMLTRYESDWLPRDSHGNINRRMFKRMWKHGWQQHRKGLNG